MSLGAIGSSLAWQRFAKTRQTYIEYHSQRTTKWRAMYLHVTSCHVLKKHVTKVHIEMISLQIHFARPTFVSV